MCGIFALLNVEKIDDVMMKAFERGAARGPENSTIVSHLNSCIMGFHRLAINGLNIPDDNQPLNIKDCVLICNGEIYNAKQLSTYFKQLKTGNDCEIIIHLYREYGIDYTLQLLDGVFAFVLLDLKKKELFIARDTFGVRPMYMATFLAKDHFSSRPPSWCWGFASEMKALAPLHPPSIIVVKPGVYSSFYMAEGVWKPARVKKAFTSKNVCIDYSLTHSNSLIRIRHTLEEAVRKRVMTTERPIACLLSGGLDSSLIAALVAKYYGRPVETYSIGFKGSEDLKHAKIVADHIGSIHHSIEVTEEYFFEHIPETIRAIESYDTTTVRASVGNYLVSKYIRDHSEAKVVFNGDGADEVAGSYMYFYYAADPLKFDEECRRLLDDIHLYDVLRSDRSISSNGLEPRTPFLDKAFVQAYLSIPAELRDHGYQNKQEKYLIRAAFSDMLPPVVLFRGKEAFSDGVSSNKNSWFEVIQQKISEDDGIQRLIERQLPYKHNAPKTDEQKYYRAVFEEHFKGYARTIPYFWMPKWVDAEDCSARVLSVYKNKSSQ